MKDHHTNLYSWLDNKVVTYSTKEQVRVQLRNWFRRGVEQQVEVVRSKRDTHKNRRTEGADGQLHCHCAKHARSPTELAAQRVDEEDRNDG